MFSNIHLSSASMRITVITIITVAALVVQEKEKIVRLFEWDFFSNEDFSLKSKPTERSSSATKNECRFAENYFNRRYFRLNNSEISYNITGSQRGNAVECNRTQLTLCEFTMKDVVYCLDSLSAKRNRSPMYIAFVGDSTVRQHFVLFLRLIPNYDRKIERNLNILSQYHYHEDRNVTSWLFDDLRISFYWRNLIKDDLIADFKRWASTNNSRQVPDLIILGVTAHHIDQNNHTTITDSFRIYENLLEKELKPLIKQSLTVHSHQEIVWLSQSLTSMDKFNRGFYPETIRMFNDAIRRILLKDTRVVIWDTVNSIVEEYLRACTLTKDERRDNEHVDKERVDNGYFNCKDFIHPGMGALSIATQLIISHICQSAS